MDSLKPIADKLFLYLRDIIYNPAKASLDISELPEAFADLGKGMQYLNRVISETRGLSRELAEGNLNCELPPPGNEIAAPLKSLHASLKHLTWQAQMVAQGKYNQKVSFMGDFSEAFNDMIDQLRQRELENLDEKTRLKSHLAKTSHELRTPLNAILGMSKLAQSEEMSDTARKYAINIHQAGTNLLNIINDILDFAKIESGRFEPNDEDYLLSDLITSVTNIIKIRAMDSGLEFRIDIDGDLPNMLYGDPACLNQILLNLLSNAVKYTKSGFVAFSVSGDIVGEAVNLFFTVSDSGRGIKEEDIQTLFDEYSQFDKTANRGVEGTGLGLAITQGLVRALSGDIIVESVYGEGSKFTVRLPQLIRDDKKISDAKKTAPDNDYSLVRFTAPQAKILVVDDIDINLMVVEGILKPYKMQVDLCESSTEALELILSGVYDLILLDHKMPVLDGMEIAACVRQQSSTYFTQVPLIILTANVFPGSKEIYLKGGFNDFLSKPIDIDAMNAALEKWVPKEKQEWG